MVLHRLLANEKFFSDFFVAVALRDELHDFFFPIAQQRFFAARAAIGGLRESLHDFGSHVVVEPDFAAVDFVDASYKQVRGGLFEDYATSAQPHGAHHIPVVFGGSEHDDARGELVKIDFFKNGQAIFIGHAQIEQENIGLELGQHLDAVVAVRGFANDGDFLIAVE